VLKRYYFYIDFERRKSKNNFLNRQIVFITFILMSVYLTLPKVRAAQAVWATRAEFLAKCIPLKVTYLSYRKKTERLERREGEILVKKGC